MLRYNENRIGRESSVHWGLWFSWLLAGMLGEPLAWIAVLFGVVPLQELLPTSLLSLSICLGLLGALLYGLVVGFAQSLALRRWLRGFSQSPWMRFTVVGGTARCLLILVFGGMILLGDINIEPTVGIIYVLVLGALAGMATGSMQYFALRRYTSAAFWWVPANLVAWLVAMSIWPFTTAIGGYILSGVLLGGISSAITGFTLVRMLYTKPASVTEEDILEEMT